ncbi:unnamed protein product [Umbelopsis vinacea]
MEAHDFPAWRHDLYIHHFIGDNDYAVVGWNYDVSAETYALYEQQDEDMDSTSEFMSDEVTSENVERGTDMQGIDWDQLRIRRDQYRQQRLEIYRKRNYENLRASHDGILKEVKPVRPDGDFYSFRYTKLSEKCSIVHFQLRNLLWAPNKNEVYYTYKNQVRLWSPQQRTSESVLKLSRDGNTLKASTMACKNDVLVAGGNSGEYVLKRLDEPDSMEHWGIITSDASGITNHIDLVHDRNGVFQALISSNDNRSRLLDVNTLQITRTFQFPWAVNCTALSGDKRLMCAVGDDTESIIADAQSGENDRYLATGNQDKTTRIYDIRNMSETLHVLRANIGAIRSLHFSNDGHYLAAAEPLDFVHIYDATTFDQSQVIDFFGEIAGVSFTPDDKSIYIANADDRVGSIMEFERINHSCWQDDDGFLI